MVYAEEGIKVLTAVAQFSQKIVEVNGRESHVIEGRFSDGTTNAVLNFKFDAVGRIGPILEKGRKYVVVMRESKGEVVREGHIIALLTPQD